MAFSFLEGEYCSSANDSVSPPVGERHSFILLGIRSIAHLPRRTRCPYNAYAFHPMDLAVNKVLALAGRDEARDLVDMLYVHQEILPLGPLVWAAVGKDPGFSPESLLEQLRRSGRFRPEDIARLDLARPIDLQEAKQQWLTALAEADAFVTHRPADEVGCLYYSSEHARFVQPTRGEDLATQGVATHFGRPGGVLPRPTDMGLTPPA